MKEYEVVHPCNQCEFKNYPKLGKWVAADGRTSTWRRSKEYIKNPCPCQKVRAFVDWLEGRFLLAPTRHEQTQYVGGNILDKSVLQGIE